MWHSHTESSKMFDVLKSRYITGSGFPCKKASPFAAPSAIFILLDQGSGMAPLRVIYDKHQHAYSTMVLTVKGKGEKLYFD